MSKPLLSIMSDVERDFFGKKRKKRIRKYKKKPKVKGKRASRKSYGNLNKSRQFHRKKHRIRPIIKSTIGKKEIIYGETALNMYFPNWLDRPTQDIDVFSPTPRKDAIQAERKLDRAFGGDFFFVKRALHPGTHKVVAHTNQEGYADFTKPEEKIPSKVIRGKNVVTLFWIKKRIKKTLKNPEAKYRHAKDKDSLNRILIYESMRK